MRYVETMSAKRHGDRFFFDLIEVQRRRSTFASRHRYTVQELQIVGLYYVVLRKYDCTFDCVSQCTHVTWPRIRDKSSFRIFRK